MPTAHPKRWAKIPGPEKLVAALQAIAEQAPKAETFSFIQRGEEAATQIDLDETETRAWIDQQLRDRGWEAETQQLRYANGIRPARGRSMAIAKWPTASGPAGLRPVRGHYPDRRGRGQAPPQEWIRGGIRRATSRL